MGLRLTGQQAKKASSIKQTFIGLTAGYGTDVVGTSGDGSGSVNISTGTGLLVAACGETLSAMRDF